MARKQSYDTFTFLSQHLGTETLIKWSMVSKHKLLNQQGSIGKNIKFRDQIEVSHAKV